ncbi:hypothetical protein [Streptomyces sp. NPDC001070]
MERDRHGAELLSAEAALTVAVVQPACTAGSGRRFPTSSCVEPLITVVAGRVSSHRFTFAGTPENALKRR